ncbi:reverse transcriptase domain, reverse transcriptase zinc-binding domain protein [Tanacetum coccineum]
MGSAASMAQASVYMFPNFTISEIEKLLKGFLWCQGPLTNGKAKVAWKVVCLPKEQGKESLWVKWVNVVKLKGASIWEIEATHGDSCGWKKLLELRSRIKNHVFYSVGNGKNVSMWFDRWDMQGPISDIIPRKIWYEERYSDNEKVVDMIERVFGYGLYAGKVDWYHVVWFTQFQPRQAFILWLAILGRLATQDRVEKWSGNTKMECHLCNKEKDSHSHLFFKYEFSKHIWDMLRNKMFNMSNQEDLTSIVSKISLCKAKNNLGRIVNRLVHAAAVYFIWQKRNKRLFKQEKRIVEKILKIIDAVVVGLLHEVLQLSRQST